MHYFKKYQYEHEKKKQSEPSYFRDNGTSLSACCRRDDLMILWSKGCLEKSVNTWDFHSQVVRCAHSNIGKTNANRAISDCSRPLNSVRLVTARPTAVMAMRIMRSLI